MTKEAHLNKRVLEIVKPVEITLELGMTIRDATHLLREHMGMKDGVFYFYVVDNERHLRGVVSSRELLLRNPDLHIEDILRKRLYTIDDQRTTGEALELMEKRRLLALPVVNALGEFLGTIDVHSCLEEQMDLEDTRRRMEVFQLMGLYLDKGRKLSVWKSYRNRMPWIFCNMLGGFACAIISNVFDFVLAKVLILAMFIPLVLSLSESISMQSMTESIQETADKVHRWGHKIRYILREARLYILLALTSGLVVGAISLLWGDGILPALTIGVGITISILITATIGGIIPLCLHAWKLDPKVASGPIVLMFADVITTTIYLTLATWWLV
ncbi:MAG: Magnesium transporter MgtE [Chlamydiia bacterium]|nr:Magnesium transporter MgtE [Chlamydiia bacterium]